MSNQNVKDMVSLVLSGLMNVHDSIWTLEDHKVWCFANRPALKQVVDFEGKRESLLYVIRTLSERNYAISSIIRYIEDNYNA